ncbi:MAG: hypothetical protein E6J90_50170 [Deltaproteobacteria bacterium]|nr:MAG: hypothetical protein E6J90_50170 [Deltaproteobacteria bacterium]TMQ07366.1 MAG: hypothetical protein E6J91_35780 [Deltaproteobacteria bacterium]
MAAKRNGNGNGNGNGQKKRTRAQDVQNDHVTKAGEPITYYTAGHPPRKDSAYYVKSRKALHQIHGTLEQPFFGPEPIQDHHGGGLWVYDDEGWFFVRNLVGIEWSGQFCADPAKVDLLRQNARRLYAGFPKSFDEFKSLGIDLKALLDTPITDTDGVAQWTDSICNASVPLPQPVHTGAVPHGAGVHNYPTPVADIGFFVRADFNLWVVDDEGHEAAVVPTHPHGTGRTDLHVIHTEPNSRLGRLHQAAQARGQGLILTEDHPLHAHIAKQAFANGGNKPKPRPRAARKSGQTAAVSPPP